MSNNREIFRVLNRHRIRFVVIGAHAVIYHGHLRATEDTDVVWVRSPEAEQALLAALSEIDACYIGNEIDPATRLERLHPVTADYVQASHLMMLTTRFGFLDLFDYIPGLPQQNVEQLHDTSVEAEGIRYASLQWLRRMKEAAGRPNDLLDIEKLKHL